MSKKLITVGSILGLSLGLTISSASANGPLHCKGQHAFVNGNVTTYNISPTQQQGYINIVLTPPGGGDPIYSYNGGVISGEIQSQNGILSRIDHVISFAGDDGFTTNNDLAIMKLPPVSYENGSPCAFDVFESITKITGSGRFENAKGAIFAEGTISFCSYDSYQNNFTLRGMVCLDD